MTHTCQQSPCDHSEDTPGEPGSTQSMPAPYITEWEVPHRQKRGHTPHWDERATKFVTREEAEVFALDANTGDNDLADATVWGRAVTPWFRAEEFTTVVRPDGSWLGPSAVGAVRSVVLDIDSDALSYALMERLHPQLALYGIDATNEAYDQIDDVLALVRRHLS